jgi:hypothetical protein
VRQVVIREKLKLTNLPVLLVKGILCEENMCTVKARYILALQAFLSTGEKPPQFVPCPVIQPAESMS